MYTNPMMTAGSPREGNLRGIAPDVARELANRLNVPLEVVGYETSKARWADLNSGLWDVTTTAHDGDRAGVEFTQAYLESEGTFLVPPQSILRSLPEVDSDGIRIAVSADSALDAHLTRSLRCAKLARVPGAGAAAKLLKDGQADALAGLRMQLTRIAAGFPGSSILEGRFMAIRQTLAMPAGRAEGMKFLRAFLEDIKDSGWVTRCIEKNGIAGVTVTPSDTQK